MVSWGWRHQFLLQLLQCSPPQHEQALSTSLAHGTALWMVVLLRSSLQTPCWLLTSSALAAMETSMLTLWAMLLPFAWEMARMQTRGWSLEAPACKPGRLDRDIQNTTKPSEVIHFYFFSSLYSSLNFWKCAFQHEHLLRQMKQLPGYELR